jgi:hypothetical protein
VEDFILRCVALNANDTGRCKLDAMYGSLCQVHYRVAETRLPRLTVLHVPGSLEFVAPARKKVWDVLTSEYQTREEIRAQLPSMERETISRALHEMHRAGEIVQAGPEPKAMWRRLEHRYIARSWNFPSKEDAPPF